MPEAYDLTWCWAGSHLCKKQMIFFGTCHLVLFSLRQYLEQHHLESRHQKINMNFIIFMSTKTNKQANFLLCKSWRVWNYNPKPEHFHSYLFSTVNPRIFSFECQHCEGLYCWAKCAKCPHHKQCLCAYRITQEKSYLIFKRYACCTWTAFCSETSGSWNWVGRSSSTTALGLQLSIGTPFGKSHI